MAQEVFKNNVTTTLASSIGPSSVSITLPTGAGALFPTLSGGNYLRGVLTPASLPGSVYEYIMITAVTGDTLTVVRGQEGSPALSWNSGDILYLAATAASYGGFSQSPIPTGTRLIFQQSSAPTGWTKDTSVNNYALRIVSGSVTTGGSVPFTTAFSASNTVSATTLSTSQIPAHNHGITDPGHGHSITDPGHNHSLNDPGHGHSINDAGHVHAANDSLGHSHLTTDPGHGHTLNDPSHAHMYGANSDAAWGHTSNGNIVAGANDALLTAYSGTGISINGAYTGLSINQSFVSVSIASSTTGISANGSTTGMSVNGTGSNVSVNGATTGISTQNAGSGGSHTHALASLAVNYIDAIICIKN